MVRRERRQESKSTFDNPGDPNVLLPRVLKALADAGDLSLGLEETLPTSPIEGEVLDRMIQVARDNDLDDAREAVQGLQRAAATQQVTERWRFEAQSATFVLVETEWDLLVRDDEFTMMLAMLREAEHPTGIEYGNAPEGPKMVDRPDDTTIALRADIGLRTPQGTYRLHPQSETVRASVFGITGDWKVREGMELMMVSPVAIFSRVTPSARARAHCVEVARGSLGCLRVESG